MIIEGKNVVLEAIQNNTTINALFVQNGLTDETSKRILRLARENGIKINYLDKRVIDQKSVLKRHQGFVAETVDFVYSDIDDLFVKADEKGELPFFVILDGITDPHNFGAIIRSCECSGVQGIIIPKHRSVMVNETVIKTSAGAINNIKIAVVTNLSSTIAYLKEKGVWVYGCEAGGKDIYKTNLNGPIAFVIGSEGEGISRLVGEKCDDIISLPLKGSVNSLNASVATGIVLYEALRQRN